MYIEGGVVRGGMWGAEEDGDWEGAARTAGK